MESGLRNAVTIEVGETSSSSLEARFKKVKAAGEDAKNYSPSPKIQKVFFLLRDHWDFQKHYEPRVVSFGPIHHGNKKYHPGERYKLLLTYEFVNGSGKEINFLHKKIEDNIKELRECFEEEVTEDYDDEDLAWMLFVDGCAILQYMYCATTNRFKQLNIRTNGVAFGRQDLFLLENQLPYRLLKWLMCLSNLENELLVSIENFVAHYGLVYNQQLKLQQTKGKRGDTVRSDEKIEEQRILCEREPVHLLDLLRMTLLGKQLPAFCENQLEITGQSHRNIQELKAAGFRLKCSGNSCFYNISYRKKVLGHLYLPRIIVDDSTRPKFLNLIAYEMCPDFENDFGIISYISFLDSLISEPDDVKELRKARVLYNYLGSDEEVARLFNEIATDLVPNPYIYHDVNVQIQNFFDFKCNICLTWMVQFIHDHFSSPWTILALCGLLLGIGLTATQTWYAVKSSRSGP